MGIQYQWPNNSKIETTLSEKGEYGDTLQSCVVPEGKLTFHSNFNKYPYFGVFPVVLCKDRLATWSSVVNGVSVAWRTWPASAQCAYSAASPEFTD